MKSYLTKIIIPYIVKKTEDLKLLSDHRALVIFDNFNGQCTQELFQLLDANSINFILVPANCMDRLQPLDVSTNKPAKNFLREQFQAWYAEQISSQIEDSTEIKPVDLKMSIVKPLGAKWMIKLYEYFKLHPEIIKNGFRAVGITDVISD